MPESFGYVTDRDGDEVHVEVGGADVFITVNASTNCVALDAAGQERFAQAYVAACHQAKVNAGTAARPVKHGPGCGCTPCKAEPSYQQAAG